MSKFALSLHRLTVMILAVLLVVLSGCLNPGEQTVNNAPESTVIRSGDFTLTNLDGEGVSLSDLRGQAVLLNFWATW
jgi:cytochrome oxidase Cu insertion factor (SCO1/SenC/PrrC family)